MLFQLIDTDMITSFNLLNYLKIEHPKGDYLNIIYVSDLSGGNQCLSFCKYENYQDYIKNFSNSLILLKNRGNNFIEFDANSNLLVTVDDPRFSFAELVIEFNLRDLYTTISPTPYGNILKSSKLISKSAKIYNAQVGEGCAFHHNVLIGVDDFCPIDYNGKRLMFPQLGGVKLGNRVEIFNNSIIGRGALSITEVGDDTKIDALCQIGHNCKIGKNCMITAGTIIAGSTTIGDNTFIGIGTMVRNGLHIGSNVTIAQGSNVVSNIPNNAIVMGNPARVVGYNASNFSATQVP